VEEATEVDGAVGGEEASEDRKRRRTGSVGGQEAVEVEAAIEVEEAVQRE